MENRGITKISFVKGGMKKYTLWMIEGRMVFTKGRLDKHGKGSLDPVADRDFGTIKRYCMALMVQTLTKEMCNKSS